MTEDTDEEEDTNPEYEAPTPEVIDADLNT